MKFRVLFFLGLSILPISARAQEATDRETVDSTAVAIEEIVIVTQNVRYRAGGYHLDMVDGALSRDRSAMQVLGMLPGLKTDENGLTLKNVPIAMVYIDDRLITNLDELTALRADQIHRIEVQNNAGAGYAATTAGGIVRIRLKKLNNNSFYGSISPELNLRESGWGTALGAPISMRFGQLSVYNYLRGSYSQSETLDVIRAEYRDSGYALDTRNEGHSSYRAINETLSLMYDINDRHTLGIGGQLLAGKSNPANLMQTTASELISGGVPQTGFTHYQHEGEVLNRQYMGSLNYDFLIDTLGSKFVVKGDFLHYNTERSYDYNTHNYTHQDGAELSSDQSHERYRSLGNLLATRADFVKKFSVERMLSVGLSYNLRHVHNDNRISTLQGAEWMVDPQQSFRFIDRSHSTAAYSEWADEYRKFSYKVGLRLQWDRISYRNAADDGYNDRDYVRLFPSLSLTYVFNARRGDVLSLDVSRYSGSLPNNDRLSPRRVWLSPYSYTVGNEYLDPAHGYELDITLTLRNRWFISYMSSINWSTTDITLYDPIDPAIVYRMEVNGAKSSIHGLWVNYVADVTRWLRVDAWMPFEVCFRNYGDQRQTNWYTAVDVRLYFQALPSLRFSLSASATAPHKRLEEWQNGYFGVVAGVEKSFSDGRWQLSLDCCLLNSKLKQTSLRADESYYSVLRQPKGYRDMWCKLRVSWNFKGQGRTQVKRVKTLQQQAEVEK